MTFTVLNADQSIRFVTTDEGDLRSTVGNWANAERPTGFPLTIVTWDDANDEIGRVTVAAHGEIPSLLIGAGE